MDPLTIILIAIALAMDAFAVSIISGCTIKSLKISNTLKVAISFGAFQGIMPIIGWFAGLGFKDFIGSVDHWVAFGLLSAIGLRMIYESFRMGSHRHTFDPMNVYILLMLSVATSIDALAIGISLSVLSVDIVLPAVVIGIITFMFSVTGMHIGNRFGHIFERKIEVLGGIILIGIGVRILLEHIA